MSENPFTKIKRRLVDYFDHYGNGFIVEQRHREWFASRDDLTISLTELALALAADFALPTPPSSLPEDTP